MADILVVDDEIGIRELLSEILGDEGHTVLLAENAQQARSLRASQPVDLVLLDIWMPDTDGVTLLREWASNGLLSMPVIMMSGHATIDTAVEATRIGAIDFLEKPITLQKLLRSVQAGLTQGRVRKNPSAVVPAVVVAPVPGAMVPSAPEPGLMPRPTASPGFPFGSWPGDRAERSPPEPTGPMGEPMSIQGSGESHQGGLMDPGTEAHEGFGAREVERAVLLKMQALPIEAPLRDARDAFERAYFEYHLMREQGSMTRVAERTGLERTHLYRKLKQLGIDLSRGAWRKSSL